MSLRDRLYPWRVLPGLSLARRRSIRSLVRKARWARDHGDVYGLYMLRLRIGRELAR